MKLSTEKESNSVIARKIDLYFRDPEYAQIADLQIQFRRT